MMTCQTWRCPRPTHRAAEYDPPGRDTGIGAGSCCERCTAEGRVSGAYTTTCPASTSTASGAARSGTRSPIRATRSSAAAEYAGSVAARRTRAAACPAEICRAGSRTATIRTTGSVRNTTTSAPARCSSALTSRTVATAAAEQQRAETAIGPLRADVTGRRRRNACSSSPARADRDCHRCGQDGGVEVAGYSTHHHRRPPRHSTPCQPPPSRRYPRRRRRRTP